MPRTMGEREAEEFIARLLGERGRLTTREIEKAARERNAECPDATVRFLNKMRLSGKINGELSMKERGWVWYI